MKLEMKSELFSFNFITKKGLYRNDNDQYTFFIHGIGGSKKQWELLLAHIDRKIIPICIDLPGHGESRESMPDDIEILLTRFGHFFAELNLKKPINIVGHSLGGLIAQAIYHNYPEKIEKLVLLATAPKILLHPYLHEQIISKKWDINFLEEGLSEKMPVDAKALVIKDMMAMIVNNGNFMSIEKIDFSEKLKEISKPTMIIFGKKDKVISPRRTRNMALELPNVKLIELPEVGHYPHLEEPKLLGDLINQFLN